MKINSIQNLKMKGKGYSSERKFHNSIKTLSFAEQQDCDLHLHYQQLEKCQFLKVTWCLYMKIL